MISLNINELEAESHFLIVKPLIQSRINSILRSKYINVDSVKQYVPKGLEIYLNSLLNDTELRRLIKAKPEDLINIVQHFKKYNSDFIKKDSPSNLILRNVFINHCYNNPTFIKTDFIKRVNIDTCPYCNRNYIYYLDNKKGIQPQIDHFYPQKNYPFFGVSFYNLIPSCQTCNGTHVKGELDPTKEDLVNPYLIKDSDFKFKSKILSINYQNPLHDKTSIELNFMNSLPGNLKVFKLKEFYQQHTDHVLELIIKSKLQYSKSYRHYLMSYKGMRFTKSDIDRLIIGNYSSTEEVHKRPFAKLYQDIAKQLKLIK